MRADVTEFQASLNDALFHFLETEQALYRGITSHQPTLTLLAHIKEVSAGGKRLRPFLVFSLLKHSHPKVTPADVMPLLLAVELFHVFCLIHDDIMDEAALRHGVSTVHTEALKTLYTNSPIGRRIADNQAILVGDILFNSVFKLLHSFTAKQPELGSSILQTFHTLIDEVCIGQMIDVHLTSKSTVTIAEVVEKNRLKTAYYSFARPLHLGVLIANRPELESFVLAFGEQLGLLYQIQDDLLDVIGDVKDVNKPLFQDVAQNQHTVLSTFIRQQGGVHSETLDRLSGQPTDEPNQALLHNVFIESGAISYAESMIHSHEQTAINLMAEHNLNEEDTTLFTEILSLINKRKR